jgi:hypothetical protein
VAARQVSPVTASSRQHKEISDSSLRFAQCREDLWTCAMLRELGSCAVGA